jgi:hypothetical protein
MELRALLDHPALAGIALRGCASRSEWQDTKPDVACLSEVAHAHLSGKYHSWVCVRDHRDLNATTLRHELAHLLTGHAIHNERWRRAVRSLGGRVEQRYRPHNRASG